jgi:hypothetical protein
VGKRRVADLLLSLGLQNVVADINRELCAVESVFRSRGRRDGGAVRECDKDSDSLFQGSIGLWHEDQNISKTLCSDSTDDWAFPNGDVGSSNSLDPSSGGAVDEGLKAMDMEAQIVFDWWRAIGFFVLF